MPAVQHHRLPRETRASAVCAPCWSVARSVARLRGCARILSMRSPDSCARKNLGHALSVRWQHAACGGSHRVPLSLLGKPVCGYASTLSMAGPAGAPVAQRMRCLSASVAQRMGCVPLLSACVVSASGLFCWRASVHVLSHRLCFLALSMHVCYFGACVSPARVLAMAPFSALLCSPCCRRALETRRSWKQ